MHENYIKKSQVNMSEPKPPTALVKLQEWFSESIMFSSESDQEKTKLEDEKYLKPSVQLSTKKRLKIYSSDYWTRCLNSLSDDFPLLMDHFGKKVFIKWMKLYLEKFPSSSYTLFYLPKDLVSFLKKEYLHSDRGLVLDLAAYEWAHRSAFFAEAKDIFNPMLLTESERASILSQRFELQPSVTCLKRKHKISYKNKRKDSSPHEHYICVYRQGSNVKEETLSKTLFKLLEEIKKGLSIQDALVLITEFMSAENQRQCESEIEKWLATCVKNGWFIHPKKKE